MRFTIRRPRALDLLFVVFLALAVLAARAPTNGGQLAQGSGGSGGGGSGTSSGGSNGGSGGTSSSGGSGGSDGGSSSGGSGSSNRSGGGGDPGGGGGGPGPAGAPTTGARPATTPSTRAPRSDRPQGTRPDPTPAELARLAATIPHTAALAIYESIANLPPFLVLACLEGLAYAIVQIPPSARYRDPFLADSPNQQLRDYCSRFDVHPLQALEKTSGASSRPIEPDDVRIDVRIDQGRIEVRERLREGFGRAQLLLATLVFLLLLVAITALVATVVRQRRQLRALRGGG